MLLRTSSSAGIGLVTGAAFALIVQYVPGTPWPAVAEHVGLSGLTGLVIGLFAGFVSLLLYKADSR